MRDSGQVLYEVKRDGFVPNRGIAELMKRLITAPCVGIVVGAVELGAFLAALTMIDTCQGCFLGSGSDWAYYFGTLGMIAGGVIGGIIGLVVALTDAHARRALLLGTAIGFGFAMLIVLRNGSLSDLLSDPLEDFGSMVPLILVPMGASTGFLSAVATAPSKEPQPRVEPSRSGRIFE